MADWYRAAWPLLARLDPERAHRLAIAALGRGLVPGRAAADLPLLHQTLWGLAFRNPVGLAAGFDKHAEAIDGAFGLGFGFVEIGGVTPLPQPGNPRPRLFRLTEDRAVINRFGFNSDGAAVVRARLAARRRRPTGPLAVNLAKNKESAEADADYAAVANALAPFVDLLVVNVSSPNTPGLRALQGAEILRELIVRLRARLDAVARSRPLLVKIAPDLDEAEAEAIAGVALDLRLDGLIVSNTTTARAPELTSPHRGEVGGLSGRPLRAPSTRLLGRIYRATGGRVTLIGCGGIADGADAYAKIRAGASLVQLYTALVYDGPALVRRIVADLAMRVAADGFPSIAAAVGADHQDITRRTPA